MINNKVKFSDYTVQGNIVRDDERYVVVDNTTLKNLTLSKTHLFPDQQTRGHTHKGQEEVYFFVKGSGVIQLDNEAIHVKGGDTVLIEDGVFHKVFASRVGLEFICVFDKKRNNVYK